MIKQIGAALEIPPEVLLKQFTTTYSAARGALNEFWRTCNFRIGISAQLLDGFQYRGQQGNAPQLPRPFPDHHVQNIPPPGLALSYLMNGDTIALLPMKQRAGQPYQLCIRLIEADRVCSPDLQDRRPVHHLASSIRRRWKGPE